MMWDHCSLDIINLSFCTFAEVLSHLAVLWALLVAVVPLPFVNSISSTPEYFAAVSSLRVAGINIS